MPGPFLAGDRDGAGSSMDGRFMKLTCDSVRHLARALRRAADGRTRPVPPSPAHLGRAAVPVAIVGSRSEAELIVGMLRDHGLNAAVSADDAGGQEPELQTQGVRVLVAPADELPARRLLAAVEGTSSAAGSS